MPILSITILFSLIVSLVIFCIPCKYPKILKVSALSAHLILLVLNGFMLAKFNPLGSDFQFQETYSLAVNSAFDFNVGLDGISLLLINLI